jgi:hypothetical protein
MGASCLARVQLALQFIMQLILASRGSVSCLRFLSQYHLQDGFLSRQFCLIWNRNTVIVIKRDHVYPARSSREKPSCMAHNSAVTYYHTIPHSPLLLPVLASRRTWRHSRSVPNLSFLWSNCLLYSSNGRKPTERDKEEVGGLSPFTSSSRPQSSSEIFIRAHHAAGYTELSHRSCEPRRFKMEASSFSTCYHSHSPRTVTAFSDLNTDYHLTGGHRSRTLRWLYSSTYAGAKSLRVMHFKLDALPWILIFYQLHHAAILAAIVRSLVRV